MYIKNMPIEKLADNQLKTDIKIPSEYVNDSWNKQCVHMLQNAFRKPIEAGAVTIAEYLEVQDWLMHDDVSMDILENGTKPSGHAFVDFMTVTRDENCVTKWLKNENDSVTNSKDLLSEYVIIDLVNFIGHWLVTRFADQLTGRFTVSYQLFIVANPDMNTLWNERLALNEGCVVDEEPNQ